jgi:hypothetical protein
MQWGLIIIGTTCHDYIGHNNTSVGFVTFLVMLCVNILFNN